MSDFDSELDASGLNCPLPSLRAKKAISALQVGQTLKIIATDPGSASQAARKFAVTRVLSGSASFPPSNNFRQASRDSPA